MSGETECACRCSLLFSLPSDDLASCLECDGLIGGHVEDLSAAGPVRSVSAPQPLDPVPSDSQSKFHCDFVSRSGGDVYRYPSPLHAVALQSPAFLQMLGHGDHSMDEGLLKEAGTEALQPEPSSLCESASAPHVSMTCSSAQKRLDSYILGLLQRRALPVRTTRPRTSISTDPSKSILRQASLCVRSGPGSGSGSCSGSGSGIVRGSDLKPSWLPAAAVDGTATPSPPRQQSVEKTPEELDAAVFPDSSAGATSHGFKMNVDSPQTLVDGLHPGTNSLLKKRNTRVPSYSATATLPKDFRELTSPKTISSSKGTTQSRPAPSQDLTLRPAAAAPSNGLQIGPTEKSAGGGSSFHSQNGEGAGRRSHMVNGKSNNKLCKGSKTVKTGRAKTGAMSERGAENPPHRLKPPLQESGGHSRTNKASRRAHGSSSRTKRLPAPIPEDRVLDRDVSSAARSTRGAASRSHHHGKQHHAGHHHHGSHHLHHGRDQVVVVAKPKHKRSDYRRLRAVTELPHDDAVRRQRRHRRELLSRATAAGLYLPGQVRLSSPYAYVAGSDSEYSAECASLFHSTIVDTSEDERSNYTTNCFGDSESSQDEYVEDSSTSSDTEESGGGGAGGGAGGGGRSQPGLKAAAQGVSPAQAKTCVKIKASHNLKKKILRFRSGSLRLMTTV